MKKLLLMLCLSTSFIMAADLMDYPKLVKNINTCARTYNTELLIGMVRIDAIDKNDNVNGEKAVIDLLSICDEFGVLSEAVKIVMPMDEYETNDFSGQMIEYLVDRTLKYSGLN